MLARAGGGCQPEKKKDNKSKPLAYDPFSTLPVAYAMMIALMCMEAEPRQGGDEVDFVAVLDQVITLLRQRGRLTYRTLQRQFELDDAALEDLKEELLYGQPWQSMRTGASWSGWATPPHPLLWHLNPPLPLTPSRPVSPHLHAAISGGENPHLTAVPWKASASRSRCCLPTSKARWSCWPTAIPKRPASSSTRCWSA